MGEWKNRRKHVVTAYIVLCTYVSGSKMTKLCKTKQDKTL